MKRIILGLITVVGAVSALSLGVTGAFFSDTETSTGNTFAAGAIDLLVDNESYYNGNVCAEDDNEWTWQGEADFPVPGTPCTTSWELDNLTGHLFFDFNDIKPDDEGEDTISLHVQNDAWACMNISLTSNDDNSSTEPELLVPDAQDVEENIWDGELAQTLEMVWWADDGDNVLETGEPIIIEPQTLAGFLGGGLALGEINIPLADSENNVWGNVGDPIPAAEDDDDAVYIAKAWCFGDISTDPVAEGQGENPSVASGITCDGLNLNNLTQTDGATLDVSFEAVQARNNPNFTCEEPPVFTQCETPSLAYADSVVSSSQGVRKNGTPVTADRDDPLDALGAPQSTGTPFDSPVVADSFFSLGFKNAGATPGGEIVVEFTDNVIVDGPGNDIRVWEVTGGTSYPIEKVKIEVSQNGTDWFEVTASVDRDAEADLADSGLEWAKYIRVTDVSPIGPFEATADGYDLDAISALNCGVPEEGGGGQEPTTATLTLVKQVVNDQTTDGDEQVAGAWTLFADGPTDISGATGSGAVTNAVVNPGAYNLSESALPDYTGSAWACVGGTQNDSDTVTLAAGDVVTCTITNTENPEQPTGPVTLVDDGFGSGTCLTDIAGWDEDAGDSCVNGTVAASTTASGDNTVSPDGGRFALLGNGGYICRSINATGLQNLQLKYYARGDSDAEAGDLGTARIYTGGTCAAPTGLVASSTHALTLTSWSALQTVNLPVAVNNTTFLLKFTADTNNGNESFRVDGVNVSGTAI